MRRGSLVVSPPGLSQFKPMRKRRSREVVSWTRGAPCSVPELRSLAREPARVALGVFRALARRGGVFLERTQADRESGAERRGEERRGESKP
jgi:hypothetical protein